MDGYESAQCIPEREAVGMKQRIPIIAMTANVLPEDLQKCLAPVMDDFVAKPIIHNELFNAVVRWLPASSMDK
jgi:CheY-like chemotaxis protein